MFTKRKKGFTLFTALVSFVIIAIGIAISQTFIKTEFYLNERVNNLQKQNNYINVVEALKVDSSQLINFEFKRLVEDHLFRQEVERTTFVALGDITLSFMGQAMEFLVENPAPNIAIGGASITYENIGSATTASLGGSVKEIVDPSMKFFNIVFDFSPDSFEVMPRIALTNEKDKISLKQPVMPRESYNFLFNYPIKECISEMNSRGLTEFECHVIPDLEYYINKENIGESINIGT